MVHPILLSVAGVGPHRRRRSGSVKGKPNRPQKPLQRYLSVPSKSFAHLMHCSVITQEYLLDITRWTRQHYW